MNYNTNYYNTFFSSLFVVCLRVEYRSCRINILTTHTVLRVKEVTCIRLG